MGTTEPDFDTKRGIALLMGYQVSTMWRVKWHIVYPSGVRGGWLYDDERAAWRDVFDIAGITNGRLFAPEDCAWERAWQLLNKSE